MSCAYILKRPEFSNVGEQFDWEIENNQVPYELPIVLPKAAWIALPDALDEISHAVRQAQSILNHAHSFMLESASADPGIIAMLEMAERGFKHISGHEGEFMDDVATILRRAVSKMIPDDAKGKTV